MEMKCFDLIFNSIFILFYFILPFLLYFVSILLSFYLYFVSIVVHFILFCFSARFFISLLFLFHVIYVVF